jgi:hypothetical protein
MASVLSSLPREFESNVHPICVDPCGRLKILIARTLAFLSGCQGSCEPIKSVDGAAVGVRSGCFRLLIDRSGPRPRSLHLRS